MSDVQFEDQTGDIHYAPPSTPKGLSGLIIQTGLVSNEKQANMLMIGLIVILILISFFAIRSMNPNNNLADDEKAQDPFTNELYEER